MKIKKHQHFEIDEWLELMQSPDLFGEIASWSLVTNTLARHEYIGEAVNHPSLDVEELKLFMT